MEHFCGLEGKKMKWRHACLNCREWFCSLGHEEEENEVVPKCDAFYVGCMFYGNFYKERSVTQLVVLQICSEEEEDKQNRK